MKSCRCIRQVLVLLLVWWWFQRSRRRAMTGPQRTQINIVRRESQMADGNAALIHVVERAEPIHPERAPSQYAFSPVNIALGGSANACLTFSSTSACTRFLLSSSSILSRAAFSSLTPMP